MAGKLIIDWSKAPVDATHASKSGTNWFKDFDGMNYMVWLLDDQGGEWVNGSFGGTVELIPRPVQVATTHYSTDGKTWNKLPWVTEQSMCCGTTCDREAVKRYIERLEVVADAAHHLEQSGVLAGTPRMQNLKTALEELQSE